MSTETGKISFICLMDLAVMGMKKLKKDGILDNMEESDEINACSIVVPVSLRIRQRNGSSALRMRRTTIRRRSNLSVELHLSGRCHP